MVIFAFFFCVKGNKLSGNAIIIGGICILNYLITMIANHDWRGSYALLCMNIMTAIAFAVIYERTEFYTIYVNCIAFVSVLCIIATYVIVPLFSNIIPMTGAENGSTYYNLILSYPLLEAGKHRLNIIWTEPGLAAAYLMFALIFELFLLKPRRSISLILILAMICTMSSTGYVLLMMIIATFALEQMLKKNNIMILIVFIVAGILGVGIMYMLMPEAMEDIIGKYQFSSLNLAGRLAPMIYNMDKWRTSPLYGLGFHEGDFRVNYKIYRGVLFANTSTTTLLFHNFGFLLPLLSIISSWKISSLKKANKIIVLLLTFTLVLGVNFENQVLDQIYTIILFTVFMPVKGKYNEDIIA
jgi:hypothetical protein